MAAPKRIVFATDFSDASVPAFEEAVRLALEGADLLLVHAYTVPSIGQPLALSPGAYDDVDRELKQNAERRLDELVNEAQKRGARASGFVVFGDPYEAISRVAKSEGADLVVMGTHGRNAIARLVIGSVASRVIATCPCPVLTVRGSAPLTRRILVATDFSPCSEAAWQEALALAGRRGARLTLVHAYEAPTSLQTATVSPAAYEEWDRKTVAAAKFRLASWLRQAGRLAIEAESRVFSGPAEDAIVETAAALPAELVVVGTHGRRGLDRLLMGSVSANVVARSRCPVLVVPVAAKEKPKATTASSRRESDARQPSSNQQSA